MREGTFLGDLFLEKIMRKFPQYRAEIKFYSNLLANKTYSLWSSVVCKEYEKFKKLREVVGDIVDEAKHLEEKKGDALHLLFERNGWKLIHLYGISVKEARNFGFNRVKRSAKPGHMYYKLRSASEEHRRILNKLAKEVENYAASLFSERGLGYEFKRNYAKKLVMEAIRRLTDIDVVLGFDGSAVVETKIVTKYSDLDTVLFMRFDTYRKYAKMIKEDMRKFLSKLQAAYGISIDFVDYTGRLLTRKKAVYRPIGQKI